jgi:hypothetical protein
MRFIGRRLSDASPSSVDMNGRPATMPERSRMVVPEFPQSITFLGAASPSNPLPSTVSSRSSPEILTPSVLKASIVLWLSSPPERFAMRLVPFAIAEKITARWPIDLSPGTVSSPCSGRVTGSMRRAPRCVAALKIAASSPRSRARTRARCPHLCLHRRAA